MPFVACRVSLRRRRKAVATERALLLGEEDPFDYVLALALGKSWGEVQELPNEEFERWRGFMNYRDLVRNHNAKVNAARAGA